MDFNNFKNKEVLNIFCDASIRKMGDKSAGCYGAVAVYGYTIIDEIYRICSDTTNNNAEIKAIRAGILLAIRHGNKFKRINLFSDSQVSLFGIRDRIFNWTVGRGGKLYGSQNQLISSQEVFIEIANLIVSHNLNISLWHQKGHVKMNDFRSLDEAKHVFMSSNGVRINLDTSFIRYISTYNDIVDKKSRSVLYQNDIYKQSYDDALRFQAQNFYKLINNLKNGGNKQC